MAGFANKTNELVLAKNRLRTSWHLFAVGFMLVLLGFGLDFWSHAQSKNTTFHVSITPAFAVCILLLGLLFWVIAPFFSKRPLWTKVGICLLSIALWSLTGYCYETFFVSKTFGLGSD